MQLKKRKMTNNNLKLEDLGYDTFFESNRKKLKLDDFLFARVIAEHKGAYKVKNINGEYLAKITGRHKYKALSREDYPAVGDWVTITEIDNNKATIRRILPRKTILRKKYSNKEENQIIATNIDVAFIIESVDRDYNLNRFERYIILAKDSKIKPVIVLNKIDLISDEKLKFKVNQIKDRFNDVDIILSSATIKQGTEKLKEYIKRGKTYCFLGSSGVGKSSLINKLLEKNTIKTNKVSDYSQRGMHTTTSREIYILENGGILIDNPGTREVGIADSNAGIKDVFTDIEELSENCKYNDCSHTNEPGCAVLNAVESKKLDKNKYSNYIKLKKETEHYNMTGLEKRRKNRQFGKYVKTALKEVNKYKS